MPTQVRNDDSHFLFGSHAPLYTARTAARGETLQAIANDLGLSREELLAHNWHLRSSGLVAGQTVIFVPLLRPGASGPLVWKLQEALQSLRYNLAVDGDFGTGTAAALERFCLDRGLDTRVAIGFATWQAIGHALATGPCAQPNPTLSLCRPTAQGGISLRSGKGERGGETARMATPAIGQGERRTLRMGSSGPDVETLQRALNRSGLVPPVQVASRFGPATHQAIERLKTVLGGDVDGEAGPEVWDALTSAPAATPWISVEVRRESLSDPAHAVAFDVLRVLASEDPYRFKLVARLLGIPRDACLDGAMVARLTTTLRSLGLPLTPRAVQRLTGGTNRIQYAEAWAISDLVHQVMEHGFRPQTFQYDQLIHEAATRKGVSFALVKAVVAAESRFKARAESPMGAQGLMQLMPDTAALLGVNDPFNPAQNIRGGTRFLAQLLARFGTVEKAVAAYNAGPTRVQRYGGVPPFVETQLYLRRVLLLRALYEAMDDHAAATQVA